MQISPTNNAKISDVPVVREKKHMQKPQAQK